MTDSLEKRPSQENASQDDTLGRRKLLKSLAAAGGAVTAASLLPDRWGTPVIEVGALPAHAQISPINLNLAAVGTPGPGIIRITGVPEDFCKITDIQAIVTPPTGGVDVIYEVQNLAGDPITCIAGPSSQTRTTNAGGIASYDDFDACACLFGGFKEQGEIPSFTFQLVFRFVDQATYGNATATLGPYEITGF